MNMICLDMNAFFEWLCSYHDHDVVGLPGRCFHSPLARWLSALSGRAMGVDEMRYGWALADGRSWVTLPYWAQMFASYSERLFGASLTAYEAVGLLVQVETALAG